jgi:hypothetical protein
LSSLSFTAVAAVIRDASLRLSSEDSLLEMICGQMLSASDSRFFGLLKFLQFEFLSGGCFAKFFDLVCDRFDELNVSHWESLCGRLLLSVSPAGANLRSAVPPPPPIPTVETFPFHPSSPLDGIISHLTAKFGGNVQDRGVVHITANRACDDSPSYAVKNVTDLGTDSHLSSANDASQSICFDFKKMAIAPTHSSIWTHSEGANGHHMKSWVLEGSKEGDSWIEFDHQNGRGDLNRRFAVATFSVGRSESVGLLRLRQTGPNHNKSNYLQFAEFEIFGSAVGIG